MPFPIKTCVVCGEEFELWPGKPGFANRCPRCSDPEDEEHGAERHLDEIERRNEIEMNAERRKTIREMLYRNES
jgi:predicted amidophosphoribosyltransferase